MTKYLLDTHVVLWVAENSAMLSEAAKNAVLDTSAEKFVSIVSAWEVAIKLGTKKLCLEGGLPEFFRIELFDNLSYRRTYGPPTSVKKSQNTSDADFSPISPRILQRLGGLQAVRRQPTGLSNKSND